MLNMGLQCRNMRVLWFLSLWELGVSKGGELHLQVRGWVKKRTAFIFTPSGDWYWNSIMLGSYPPSCKSTVGLS